MAVKDNVIYSWGVGEDGRLGHGDTENYLEPTPILAFKNCKKVQSVSCGNNHSAAVVDDSVYTWGRGDFGQLGHGDGSGQISPKKVEALEGLGAKEVICGSDWTTVLTYDGKVFTFGYGADGRLGLGGNSSNKSTPQLVESLVGKNVVQVCCGHDHTLILLANGTVLGYGYGSNGRLGNGTEYDMNKPSVVTVLAGKIIKKIACGGYHSAAIDENQQLYLWGWNHYGQLGFQEKSLDFYPAMLVEDLDGLKVLEVVCGEGHTTVIAS
jgi:hypothetical protein